MKLDVEGAEYEILDDVGFYLTQSQTNVFFRSAPTSLDLLELPLYDSRLPEKFVDFEEL